MFCFHIHSLYNLSAANFLYRLVKTVILFCNVSPPPLLPRTRLTCRPLTGLDLGWMQENLRGSEIYFLLKIKARGPKN